MGVQDNPRCIGNWAVSGLMGACNLLERLEGEGYPWDDDQRQNLRSYARRLAELADGDLDVELTKSE